MTNGLQSDSKLRSWRKTEGRTILSCAEEVGTTRQTWAAWEQGKWVPGSEFMARIIGLTGGKVTANDFYPQIESAA